MQHSWNTLDGFDDWCADVQRDLTGICNRLTELGADDLALIMATDVRSMITAVERLQEPPRPALAPDLHWDQAPMRVSDDWGDTVWFQPTDDLLSLLDVRAAMVGIHVPVAPLTHDSLQLLQGINYTRQRFTYWSACVNIRATIDATERSNLRELVGRDTMNTRVEAVYMAAGAAITRLTDSTLHATKLWLAPLTEQLQHHLSSPSPTRGRLITSRRNKES